VTCTQWFGHAAFCPTTVRNLTRSLPGYVRQQTDSKGGTAYSRIIRASMRAMSASWQCHEAAQSEPWAAQLSAV